MAFKIIHADITTLNVDAIVNSTDQVYSGRFGVDRRINLAAGPKLKTLTDGLSKLHIGQVRTTESFNLPCKYIIHTNGPAWTGSSFLESTLLGSCYRNSIETARNLGCKSIAFPLISSKSKLFPKEKAFSIAVFSIFECLKEKDDIEVLLVLFDDISEDLSSILNVISKEIAKNYNLDSFENNSMFEEERYFSCCPKEDETTEFPGISENSSSDEETPRYCCRYSRIDMFFSEETDFNNAEIERFKNFKLDESFTDMLRHLMREKNLEAPDVYNKAGILKQTFSNLLAEKAKHPSKMTAYALSFALELDEAQTRDFVEKAGYSITNSSLQDVVMMTFVKEGIRDVFKINDILYSLDLELLPNNKN